MTDHYSKNRYFAAHFWWGIAKILYFIGLNFENLYGRNTIGFSNFHKHQEAERDVSWVLGNVQATQATSWPNSLLKK